MNKTINDSDINIKKFIENINNNNNKKIYLSIKEINFDPSNNYTLKNCNFPYIIKGFCKNTDAFKKWNLNNIADIFGNEKVNVEYYNTFYNFYNARISKHKKYTVKDVIDKTSTEYLYLGEVDLKEFNKQSILDDVNNPFINENIYESVIFFGKNGSSSTHIHSSNDYILNQIFGEKTLYLFNLRDNYDKGLFLGNPCLNETNFICNNFELKLSDHNLFKLYKVILKPGDTLILPPWWWHNAISNDFSCSITHKIKRSDISYYFKYPELIINQFLIFIGCRDISKVIDCDFFEKQFKINKLIIAFIVFSISISTFVLSTLLYSSLLYYLFDFVNINISFIYLIIIVFIYKLIDYNLFI